MSSLFAVRYLFFACALVVLCLCHVQWPCWLCHNVSCYCLCDRCYLYELIVFSVCVDLVLTLRVLSSGKMLCDCLSYSYLFYLLPSYLGISSFLLSYLLCSSLLFHIISLFMFSVLVGSFLLLYSLVFLSVCDCSSRVLFVHYYPLPSFPVMRCLPSPLESFHLRLSSLLCIMGCLVVDILLFSLI